MSVTNWFVIAAGGLYLAAAGWYWYTDSWKLAAVFVAYAAANFVLGTMR